MVECVVPFPYLSMPITTIINRMSRRSKLFPFVFVFFEDILNPGDTEIREGENGVTVLKNNSDKYLTRQTRVWNNLM